MKKYRIHNKILFILIIISAFLGCSTSEDKGSQTQIIYHPAEEKPQVVVYSKYVPINITETKTYKVNASVIPEAESSSVLVYKSNNEDIATVSKDGNITIHKTGIASITVSLEKDSTVANHIIVNAYEGSSNVENKVPVMAVAVDTTYIKLQKGKGLHIFPSVRPGNASDKELNYLSTNTSVADIKDGLIEAKNNGNAGIIVHSKSNPAKYAFIHVEVSDSTDSSDGGFTAPDGVTPIDLNADPMSLIAKYQILEYAINGEKAKKADVASNLRVNVNLDELGAGFVKILMYVNLNGKEVRLIQKKNMNDYGSIPDIFTSLGADITGKYTMKFTLDPKNYSELAKQGLINKGETLILNIGKIEALAPTAGLGSDITFDESSVPVESGGGADTETPGNPDGNTNKPGEIKVESIKFSIKDNIKEIIPFKANETIKINAEVLPENASNKTLTWKSSNDKIASVNKDGLVTIHKNGSAIITAYSSNGKKAEIKIIPATMDDFQLIENKKLFILGIDTEMQLSYEAYPPIFNGENLKVTYSSDDQNIASVDDKGNVKGLVEGETKINVTIGNITKQCYIEVLPEDAANIPVESIVLEKNNGNYPPTFGSFKLETQILPETAVDRRLKYETSNDSVAVVNAVGMVTIKGVGEAKITITSLNNPNAKAEYKLIVESLPTKAVYERFDYGIAIHEKVKIIPVLEGNPSNTKTTYKILDNHRVASVDENTGEVTGLSSGSATLEATTVNGKKATTIINVYNPVQKGKVNSLQGTYQIVDFNQFNGHLNVGTNAYGGVERMIGEMTIEVKGNNVIIKSKIQMDSSAMNNFGGVLGQGVEQARKGQFQYTEYSHATYNENGFGSAGQTSARVTHEGDKLKLYQEWKEMGLATVQVNTWIKKKSDSIKDLKKDYFHWSRNGANYDKNANALAHHPNIKRPEKEPYYTYGLITK